MEGSTHGSAGGKFLALHSMIHASEPAAFPFSILQISNTHAPNSKTRQRKFNHAIQPFQNGILMQDVPCAPPSTAAYVVFGHSANGWREWHTENGKKLEKFRTQ